MSVRVERMTPELWREACGEPLHVLELLGAAIRVAGEDRIAELGARLRVNGGEFPVLFELEGGRAVGVEVQLYGAAALKIHTPPERWSPDAFDYCSRRTALEQAAALALAPAGSMPAGWCRWSNLCCAQPEIRPNTCGRGEDCRWHGWRPEWSR